jgi:hypothetical protein
MAEAAKATEADDGLLDVSALIRMFEESEEATYSARQLSERDRDYVDNKQLTATEEAALKARGQPPVIINRIKAKIEFLVGMEKERRIDPRAFPRTPQHEQDADGASQALKYVTDYQRYDQKRSQVWRNLIVEGAGGFDIAVEQGYNGEPEIVIRRIAWDRMFWDPASAENDFSDAGYLGVVIWMDYAEALAKYPEGKDALDSTMDDRGNHSDTYDDKPKWRLWADKKRKRIRVCQIWIKRNDDWHFAEFTKGGILKSGPSPYRTDKDESDCGLVFGSAYVDRDNNRFGAVREMISPQDEVNKRRSKALHLLNTVQIIYEDGTIDDVEAFRKEAARPDGALKVAPGSLRDGGVKIDRNIELAAAQFNLLQHSTNEIDLSGPNATMMGDKAQGSASASGKAIIASQQGGMMSIGQLLGSMQDMDYRAFCKVWYRIRQFWNAEKWIRVTDDERNVKWVGINVDPQMMQAQMAQNPEMQQRIAGMVSNIAELECDIIISDVPDAVTPALEQWQGLVELAKAGVPIPPDVLIESAPNLKNKDKLRERMQEPSPQNEIQMRGAAAEVSEKEAGAELKKAQAVKALADAQAAGMPEMGAPQQPQEYEPPPELQDHKIIAEIEKLLASARQSDAQAYKLQREAELAPQKMAMEAQNAAADRHIAQQNAVQDRHLAQKNADADRKVTQQQFKQKAQEKKRAAAV